MKRQKYTYIPKDEIESINTWSGKNIPQDKILDGAYVKKGKYARGGGVDAKEISQLAMEDVDAMEDWEVAEYLGIQEDEVNYEYRQDAIDMKFQELLEKHGGKMADGGETSKGYDVMIWETEEDRDNGDSYRYDTFPKKQDAIDMAERLYRRQGFACVEVIDRRALSSLEMKSYDNEYDDRGVVLHLSGDEYAHGGETSIRIGDYYILPNYLSPNAEKGSYNVTNREGRVVYKAKSLQDAKRWAKSKYADGGEIYTKSVEEQAQEMVGSRFFELNQQEREELINTLIKDGVIYPRVTYTQFEEEEFEYADGGGVTTASYKVVYQMVGSKDKKEKLFTDKAKAELFAETMEEDEDVKSVKLEEIKPEKPAKVAKEPTVNLFGAAKKAPATTAAKKSRPVVEVDEIAEEIARHDQLKAIIDNAKAELEIVDGRIEEVALEKYLQMYQDTGRNPPNFDLSAGGNSLIFIVMDKYIKVTPEKRAILEQYGEGLVEVVNTYEFNNAVIEKKVKGNQTVGDIISKLIMNSPDIPEADKANLITVKETMRVPKGTIDRLGEYDNIPEVFTLIEPITALK